ncbi:MAG: hypothetical protein COB20_09720 [SAR86 cluster bacterium]|uniref:Zinc finger/thioredoxin putative domain-containing protein n=1 Tax=SAR86 cluster bacterium TaxID=2030880 RepID=A0A2A4X2T2_9GAMM|nr:MAG: hypothetical protein COB20_09720 [SAR86 cluster bacterium]
MSFNVTQCPACESTFNTNSRVLAAAAGRVRCGACLNVFEAIDNFLIPEETDAAQNQDESVFVGNDPQEFFDPSSFLTRSALSEAHGDEPIRADPIDEKNLHQELEKSETVSEDFFATIAGELQGRAEAPALETRPEDEEQQIDQPEGLQASIANGSIDEEFEEEILDSFTAGETDAHELTEGAADSSLEEHIESEPTHTDVEETHIESKESFLGTGLSASFTFNPYAPPEKRIGEPEPDSTPDKETASEQPIHPSAASDAESNEDNETLLLNTQADALEPDVKAPDDSALSQMNDEVTAPTSSDETTPAYAAEEATTESLPTAGSSVASDPIAKPAADHENSGVDSEIPSDAADATQTPTKRDELPSESISEDGEPTIEAAQTSAQEVDEESSDAIRARALGAELSDEGALEAIPKENLAALGSMSTPVELLARKESRLLRSTLLFLSILLLGGLLSSQYLWQRMELYSQLPQLRPLYEVACTYLNCALPEYADIDSIRSENLAVQTHPTFANGLMINTVIRNTAAFEQPFPILILSFNSVENSVIALREFTSADYLDPGLRSIQAMPPKTPVQISLAIMDPGPEAVNYTLAFRWP